MFNHNGGTVQYDPMRLFNISGSGVKSGDDVSLFLKQYFHEWHNTIQHRSS